MGTIKLVIAGAAGRMGQRIAVLAAADPGLKVIYGLDPKSQSGPFPIGTDLSKLSGADVVIDFTTAEASLALLKEVTQLKKAYVVGTTGISKEHEEKFILAGKIIPIVKSSNMSLGVNVFFKAAQEIARALPEYSVKIEETHHVHKKDAPSGTALQAGGLIEKVSPQKVAYESFREGEVVGDHKIIFTGPADRLELFHHAGSRDILAAGALKAAAWVAKQKPGLYTMQDVLGV
jgi:4-hydroxy-tetrahydrodipicolinate reductase